jgi:GAF domain-containing protein
MASIHDRYERLLEAGLVLAADLSLPATLQRIVELAADLTGARYGALGVLGRDGVITEFITPGVTAAERAAIGHIPVGRGILGVLIDDARPLRLHDIAEDPARSACRRTTRRCGPSSASPSRPAVGSTATCT